jgi:hypothetical protein
MLRSEFLPCWAFNTPYSREAWRGSPSRLAAAVSEAGGGVLFLREYRL